MKKIICLSILFLSLNKLFSLDSLTIKNRFKIGAEYNFSNGFFLAHYLGICSNYKKHHLSIGGVFAPKVNPLIGKWDNGAYLTYDYYPNDIKNRFDIFFSFSIINYNSSSSYNTNYFFNHYNNPQYAYGPYFVEDRSSILTNLIGLGLNIKILKNLNFKTSISTFTLYYEKDKTFI